MKTSPLLSTVITLLLASFASARAQNTAFTYQGRLNDNSQPANGNYDLRFAIHDAAADGNKVAGPVTNAAITVSNGLFTTTIDFGVNVFDGSARWLETAVRSAGTANAFISLAPRQAITPAPYALFTLNAATANNVSARAVAAPQLNTPGAPASGQVLGFNGTSLVWTNTSPADAVWALSGNSGTTPGVNFLGTTDNQPLELKANGQRILRLEPNVRGPNVIGGDASNYVASGVYGATIAGGGGDSDGNVVLADSAAIGGGNANSIQPNAFASVIGGGLGNTIQENAYLAIIAGGEANTIQSRADRATISGGDHNTIKNGALDAFIGGGGGNTIGTNAWGAVTVGGAQNTAAGRFSFAAGYGAKALHDGAFVWCDFLEGVAPNFPSAATNEFALRATGGVRIVSGVDFLGTTLAGATLPAGSGSWTTLSDRNAKTHFAPVNPRALLDRLAQLPIQSWNYKSQNESIRHIGPTAQDFHAAFTFGEDEQHIATVDADGVALAAIQGLNQKLEAELNRRDAEIQALHQQLAELKTTLEKETPPTKGGAQ